MEPEQGSNGCPQPDVSDPRRRAVLKAAVTLGMGVGLTPALVFAQGDPAAIRPRAGDWLVRVDDASLTPLTAEDIQLGAQQTMAWAMEPSSRTVRNGSRLNRLLLLRFDPAGLTEATRAIAAGGIVAYTAICTHNGCEVTDWLADDQLLSCPCHQTRFDPKSEGRVVDGAAPRQLPALPLGQEGGRLVVAKTFTSRVGFDPA
jgi:Rieske Fe-S protein